LYVGGRPETEIEQWGLKFVAISPINHARIVAGGVPYGRGFLRSFGGRRLAAAAAGGERGGARAKTHDTVAAQLFLGGVPQRIPAGAVILFALPPCGTFFFCVKRNDAFFRPEEPARAAPSARPWNRTAPFELWRSVVFKHGRASRLGQHFA